MSVALVTPQISRSKLARIYVVKALKRTVPFILAIYFIPKLIAVYLVFGLVDLLRNRSLQFETIDRYFAGNGVFTWLLSPFNLLMDLLTLPFRNKGIYKLEDFPADYQDEIKRLIRAAKEEKLVEQLAAKLGDKRLGMMFFKWYGKNVETSISMPAYHESFKYVRTIGVSIFNKRQSTGLHFGPLRITLRMLYNINDVESPNIYVKVGEHIHRWKDEKLFVFDDTLQHKSTNESDEVRYCLFVDILRPSLMPGVMSMILTCVGMLTQQVNRVFYKHWTFIK